MTMQETHLTRRHFSQQVWAGLMLPLLSNEFSFARKVIEQNAMQITLERSGGYTGLPLTITVNTATLSLDKVNQLRRMVEAADFDHMPSPSMPAQPDRFEYELTIQDGDRRHTITFGEAAVPEPLKPLLHWLMETAGQH